MAAEKPTVVKYKKGGKTFEVLVHLDAAQSWRSGKKVDFESEVWALDAVFENASKGKRASAQELEMTFQTDDLSAIAQQIVKEGQLPVTEAMMRQAVDQKRKQVIELVHKYTVDPTTGKPHSVSLIETAFNELKLKLDDRKPAEAQIDLVLKALRPKLPLKYEVRELVVRLGHQYASRALPILKQYCKILQQSWEADGGLHATLEIPAGAQEQLEIALNNLTHGDLDLRIITKR